MSKRNRFIQVETVSGNAYIDISNINYITEEYNACVVVFKNNDTLKLDRAEYRRLIMFIDNWYE